MGLPKAGKNSRPKKRKFAANRYTVENETSFASTSTEKLKDVDYDDIEVDFSCVYVILNFLGVFGFLSQILICSKCHGNVTFTRGNIRVLGFTLIITCKCPAPYRVTSCPQVNNSYEINRRAMLGARLQGLGLSALNVFLSVMELSAGFSTRTYYAFVNNLHTASKAVFVLAQQKAVEEEKLKNVEAGNKEDCLSVSGDGTWKKRGFSALFGVTTLIGKFTHKVLDLVVKSSFCQSCSNWASKKGTTEYNAWKSTHDVECTANHTGSAGKMEVDAVKEMFSRSLELLKVKYETYIGDGDTKTFKSVLDLNPYEDVIVKKKECVGHVQKRMGARLREVKKRNAAKKGTPTPEKNIPAPKKGFSVPKKGLRAKTNKKQTIAKTAQKTVKLTLNLIKELTLYYGLAIRRHPNSADDMRNEIWATYYHKSSTDENPQHEHCPPGADSWCKWRVAEAAGTTDSFVHPPALDQKVQEIIRPVYEALSADDLLQRCTGGNTQNDNESLNACIWKFAPKHLHAGMKTVEIAAYLAASIFNEGYTTVLKIMNVMGIAVGSYTKRLAEEMDKKRIAVAEQKITDAAREARIQKHYQTLQQEDFYEVEEGILYGPGIAD